MPHSPALTSPWVTISIVSHGDADKIASLLEDLNSHERITRFQIILTDNLGTNLPAFDDFSEASIHVIRNQRPCGFACNHNRAFQLANADYFCVLNPDVLFHESVFDHLITLLEKGITDLVAPLIVDSSGILQDSFRRLPTPLDILKRRWPGYRFSPIPPSANGRIRPDWLAGMFLLMKSETYRKLDGFDESYHMYYEDVDLCTRARLAGLRLLVDTGVSIQHDAQRESRKNLRYLLWHVQSAFRFYNSSVYKQALKL
jgi:N-acetylglucosaminyl-diphospho-decaprenol L-rhamnosyltransferase